MSKIYLMPKNVEKYIMDNITPTLMTLFITLCNVNSDKSQVFYNVFLKS